MVGANITSTNVVSTNLSSGTLVATNITSTNVVGANITSTNVVGANITSTNVVGANITSSNFVSTNVSVGTVTATTYSGGTMSLSGDLRLAGTLTTVNITTTNISETNVSAGAITATNVTASAITATNVTGTTQTVGVSRVTSNLIALGNSNTLGNIVTTGGNVGIGTATPTSALHVAGNIEATLAKLTTSNGVVVDFIGSYGPFLSIEAYTSGNTAKLPIALNPYGGNVGIGTVSPTSKLHINGSIYVENGNVALGNTSQGIDLFTNTADGASYTTYQGGLSSWYGIGFKCRLDNTTRHVFDTRTGDFSLTGSIYANGNVGIGTASPTTRLNVVGSAMIGHATRAEWSGSQLYTIATGGSFSGITLERLNYDTSYIVNNSGNTMIGSEGKSIIFKSGNWNPNAGTTLMTLVSTGNVGIGTESPSYPVDINSKAASIGFRLQGSNVDGPVMRLENTASGGRTFHVGSTATGSGAGVGYSIYDVAGGSRLLIDANGNVGMGTLFPGARLDVSGTGAFRQIGNYDRVLTIQGRNVGVSGTADAIPQEMIHFRRDFTGGVQNAISAAIAVGSRNATVSSPSSMIFRVANSQGPGNSWGMDGADIMTLVGDGSVGVGTTTPSARLQVHAASFPNIKLTTDDVYVNAIDLDSSGKTGGKNWRLASTHQSAGEGQGKFIIQNATDGINPFVITSSGNIGLGIYNPSRQLQVAIGNPNPGNVTYGNISIFNIGGQARYHLYNGGSSAEWVFGQKSGSNHDWILSKVVSGTETDYLKAAVGGGVAANGIFPITSQVHQCGNSSQYWLDVYTYYTYAKTGSVYGFDYAEMFEWSDGNVNNDDRIGTTVVFTSDGKIRPATNDDPPNIIFGCVSATYGILGNTQWGEWQGKHLKDDYGRDILGEDGKPILNPNYNEEQTYTDRMSRPEWEAIGLLGRLRIKRGCPTNPNWIKVRDVSAQVEEWYVR